MTTETKPTVTLFLTLEEAKALDHLMRRPESNWHFRAICHGIADTARLPKALRRAIKEGQVSTDLVDKTETTEIMKLRINSEALESGKWTGRVGDKRAEKFTDIMARKHPIVLSDPIPHKGRIVYMVQPTGFTRGVGNMAEMPFKIVDSRLLVGCHARTKDLRVAVVEFPHGQFEFSAESVRPSKFTTNGAGVDPEVVESSKRALSALITKEPFNPIVRRIILHISENFK